MAIWPPTPPWCWPSRPARTRARSPRRIAAALKADPDVGIGRRGRARLRQSEARPTATGTPQLAAILDAGTDFGRSTIGAGRKVNVEYVSANPTGPMHVGHCRGAVVGDALANLLAFAGYDGHQGVLHQRRRRADRRARPFGDAALPRGARRRDRRDPGRPLSRRLSRSGRPGAGRRVRHAACCRCRKTRRCRSSRTARSTP